MTLYIFVFTIYYISMKFMRRYAGHQEPFWGIGFVLIGLALSMLGIVFSPFIIAPIIGQFGKGELYIIIILNYLIAAFVVLGIAYAISNIIKKKNIRMTKKTTYINYKWASLAAGVLGLVILIFVYVLTKKFDGFLFGIIWVLVAKGTLLHKRSLAVSNLSISELKKNRYILFLRDFKSDEVFALKKSNNILVRKRPVTLEMVLSELVPNSVPFVALGNPEDYLPTLGSQKIYLSDEVWQEQIKEYIDNASLIIVLEGNSKGLKWEIEYIHKNINPQKVKLITWSEEFVSNKSFKKTIGDNYSNKTFEQLGFKFGEINPGELLSFNKKWEVVKHETYGAITAYANNMLTENEK